MRLAPIAAPFALFAAPAVAADANSVDGVWEGGYTCGQGKTFLRLTLDGGYDGKVTGTFFFSSATWKGGENRTVPDGEFRVRGWLSEKGELFLNGDSWVDQPPDYAMVNLEGRVYTDVEGTWYEGRVMAASCTTFEVKHK